MTQQTAIPTASPRISAGTDVKSSVNSEILVSVVMPCLNEARTLVACIEQARAGCEVAVAWASKPVEPPDNPVQRTSKSVDKSERSLRCADHPKGDDLDSHSGDHRVFPPLSRGDQGGLAVHESPPNVSPPETSTHFRYEILIADNGSTDGSPELAEQAGARVVPVEQRGYGAALRGGITAAQGTYVVMGDADGSYDFGEIPRFVEKLEEGYDLVLGNRFAGGIEPGAMPWHHRYIGNPVLSGIGRLLFHPGCRDFHCGLRAIDRVKIAELRLSSTGMEFATEMVIRAAQEKLRIAEIPIFLHPDGRGRPPHLRSFRDGWRHLRLMINKLVVTRKENL